MYHWYELRDCFEYKIYIFYLLLILTGVVLIMFDYCFKYYYADFLLLIAKPYESLTYEC